MSDGRYLYFAPYHNNSIYHGLVLRYDATGPDNSFRFLWSQAEQGGAFSGAPFGPSGVITTDAGFFSISSNQSLPAGTWHHLAMTYDGSTLSMYVDGSLANSRSATGTITDSTAPLWFGNSSGSSHGLWGAIDGARIHDRALRPDEILAQSQRRKSAFPEPVVGTVGEEEKR